MPTIVGILTFINMINTISERFKEEKKLLNFSLFQFLGAVETSCSVEVSMKKFYNLGARHDFLPSYSVAEK